MKILQSQQSVTSLNSGINIVDDVITIKIKFFLGKVDYSCTLVLKPPNYNIKKLSKDASLNSYREGYYLGRKKSHSKRYDDEYTMPVSKISRHVISLNRLDESQLASSRKNSVFEQKILNTDQSHTVIDSLTPEHSLTKISDKFDRYDKFDKEIYPPATEVLKESLRYKKQLH
jgi:hypothetical protein